MEIWKDIEEYEGHYQISSTGDVKSFKNNREIILKPGLCGSGYLKVCLCLNGKYKNKMIHRLVAETFIPNPENKKEVNHKDCIKTHNDINNLEWVTPSENHIHAVKMGVHVSGVKDKRSRKVIQKTLSGKIVASYGSTREASRKTGIHQSGISDCCLGKLRKTKGFIFKFAV